VRAVGALVAFTLAGCSSARGDGDVSTFEEISDDVSDTSRTDELRDAASAETRAPSGSLDGCAGQVCGDECVDVSRDPRHCGACGYRCGARTQCVEGECRCRVGLTTCTDRIDLGPQGGCVDPRSDPRSCGPACGACGVGDLCNAGLCAGGCSEGRTACRDGCWDLSSSCQHCGQCDRACGPTQVCIGGEIVPYVPAKFCDGCPCPGCDGRRCCELAPGIAICVEAEACPST
jgi:hypothetical protein